MTQPDEPRPFPTPVRLGMLVPSSNTVVEPVITAMVAGLPEVSVHISRFRVTEISLSEASLAQFAFSPILAAARLLADARVRVIAWNGTSAAWRGFGTDEELCRRITEETGVPATSSVLALNEAFAAAGVRHFALVTPYLDAVQRQIIATYAAAGYRCVAERHENDAGNFSFSEINEARIAQRVREVAASKADAVAIVCTNLRGARLAAALEAETGLPVYDTVATGLWKSLVLAGIDPRRLAGWGSLFAREPIGAGLVPQPPALAASSSGMAATTWRTTSRRREHRRTDGRGAGEPAADPRNDDVATGRFHEGD